MEWDKIVMKVVKKYNSRMIDEKEYVVFGGNLKKILVLLISILVLLLVMSFVINFEFVSELLLFFNMLVLIFELILELVYENVFIVLIVRFYMLGNFYKLY